jgi:hypothetical protein
MFLALKSQSSHMHSPWCRPVSQQKVTIIKPLQLWLINSYWGCSALSGVLGITLQLKCVLKCTLKWIKKVSDFHVTLSPLACILSQNNLVHTITPR